MKPRIPYHVRRGAYRERFWWLEWPVRIGFALFVLGWLWKAVRWLLS
jgi:hypothetical protein